MSTGKHTARDTLNKDTPRRADPPTQPAGRTIAEVAIVEITPDRVRLRAYEIYQARNGGSGDALADWVQAEHELSGGGPDSIADASIEITTRTHGETPLSSRG